MRNLLAVSAGIGLLCVLPATASAQKRTVASRGATAFPIRLIRHTASLAR